MAQQTTAPTDEELVVILEQHNRLAIGYMSDEVAAKQDDNLDRYLGRPYGDEEEGSSNAMSMDVAEVVDWALPDLLEPFISGDRVVEYEPATQADEEWVEQATDLANHAFFVDNPGVVILHDVAKTAMIQKIGVIKTVWEDDEDDEREKMTGLSIINVNEMEQDETCKVISKSSEPVNIANLDPSVQQAFTDGQVWTVEVERTKKCGRVVLYSVPPEQFKVSQRSADLKTCEYVCHEREVRRGDLIEMGFDADVVAGLKESMNRDTYRQDRRFYDEQRKETTQNTKSSDLLTLLEEYTRVQTEDDGSLELVQIFRVGKTILDKTEVEENPFDSWSPDRIPNRLIGLGLADKVLQTQRIKTALTRNMLDNVYLANNPRFEVPSMATDENTIEDLLTYRVGGLIRTKGEGGQVRAIEVPDRSNVALQAISYMDGVREQQSGVVRNGQAASSEEIDPKSATEARNNDRGEQVRKRLMARMFAEQLLVPVFRKVLKNLVRYQDFERTIKMRGKWVTMDPRGWNADLSATCSVGLGHSNRDEGMAAANAILHVQGQAQMQGIAISPQHFYEAAKMLVKASGNKFPEKYFPDPSDPQVQQAMQAQEQAKAQQPDPKMAAVQAKAQADQANMQAKSQADQQRMQMESQMRQLELQAEAQRSISEQNFAMQKHFAEQKAKAAFDQNKAQNELKAKMIQIQADHEATLRQSATDMQLAREKIAAEAQIEREHMVMTHSLGVHQNELNARVKLHGLKLNGSAN